MPNKFETFRVFWDSKNRPGGIDDVEEFETRDEAVASVAESVFELSTVKQVHNIAFITHCGLDEKGQPFARLVDLHHFESAVNGWLSGLEEDTGHASTYSRNRRAEARIAAYEAREGW